MTTPTTPAHGAMPELPVAGYLHTLHYEGRIATAFEDKDSEPFGEERPVTVEPLVRLSDARAAIQQAAGAVPEGWKLVPVEPFPGQRIVGTAEWMRQIAHDDEPETDKTAAVYRAMLAASPTSPVQPDSGHLGAGWQPIETAPKDGAYFLAGNAHGTWVCHHQAVATSGYRFDNPWRSAMLNHWHIEPRSAQYEPATHWMPLPPPPRPDATPGQINPGSATREDGHG